jgi:ubiquinone/menaquinone biosynthesis C-methylase UbiE
MESIMQQTSPRFWNRMARRYSRRPIADGDAYRHKLEITQSFMRPDIQVLEFGCGTGTTALHHAPHVARYLAIDFSAAMIEIAREKAADAGCCSVDFEVSSIEQMEEPDTRFDMILGMSILHLVRDRAAVIAKVHRMLAPGGLFVSSTACLGDMPWPLCVFAATGRALRVFPYLAIFGTDTLRRELEAAGFDIEYDWHPGRDKALFLVARKR